MTQKKTKHTYFDYNATTPVSPRVQQSIKKNLPLLGNPSSIHFHGRQAKECIEKSREIIAHAIGTTSDKIIFTSSATEANNMVLKSLIPLTKQGPVSVIISDIEHSSVRKTAEFLKTQGIRVEFAPVNQNGIVSLSKLEALISPHTKLISVMLANNETGVIQPIDAINTIAKKHNIPVHTDAVQGIGKMPFNVTQIPSTFITISGHKIYGTKGIGALIFKDEPFIASMCHGGSHERGLRAGTENQLGIIGLATAVLESVENVEKDLLHYKRLKAHLLSQLSKTPLEWVINGSQENCIPTTLNLSFSGISGESLAMALDLLGFSISTGSACSTGSIEPSPILQAMALPKERVNQAIRISFGRDTTMLDVENLVQAIITAVSRVT